VSLMPPLWPAPLSSQYRPRRSRPGCSNRWDPALVTGAADDDPSGIATTVKSAPSSVTVSPGRCCSAFR